MYSISQSAIHSKSRCVSSSLNGDEARISSSPLVVTGVDTLKVSCWVDWTDPRLFERLEIHKKCIQETNNDMKSPFDFIKSQSKYNFNLHRRGTNKFTFRLTTGDITILLSPRSSTSAIHNTQIEIGSLSSQEDGEGVYNEIISMFNRLGGFSIKEKVQEFHVAADIIGVPIRETQFQLEDNWITRADKFSYFSCRRRMEGISIGKGNIMFRAYDKILEMKTKRATSKQDFFSKKWNVDLDTTDVTRCEFQFRRPIIKQFDVPCTTVKEIFENLQAFWNYATKEWTRFCTLPVDRKNKNQKQSKISYHWQLIQSAIFSQQKKIAQRIRQPLIKNIDALRDQAIGLCISIAASMGLVGVDIDTFARETLKDLSLGIKKSYADDESKFHRKVQLRFNECYVTVI